MKLLTSKSPTKKSYREPHNVESSVSGLPPSFSELSRHNIVAFDIARATSTLQQNPDFALKDREAKEKFMYFFTNQHRSRRLKANRSYWVFAALMAQAYFPQVPVTGVTRQSHKVYRPLTSGAQSKAWAAIGLSSSVTLRRSADGFELMVPVLHVGSSQRAVSDILLYLGAPEKDASGETAVYKTFETGVLPPTVSIGSLSPSPNLAAKTLEAFRECGAELVPRFFGEAIVFFIKFNITKEESSYLVNEKFELIKEMDLFGPVTEWVSSYYGDWGRSSTFSMPIRQIARAVRAVPEEIRPAPRTNEDNLLLDEHAEIHWIPDVEDVQRFEDVYTSAYTHDSGVFGVFDMFDPQTYNEESAKKKPPVPMPIFIDWVNLKLSYTTATGNMNIMNLDRTYKVTTHHLYRWANRKLASERASGFVSQAIQLAQFYNVNHDLTVQIFNRAIESYAREHEGLEPQDIKLSDIWAYATDLYGEPSEAAKAFLAACKETISRIEQSPETAYARYSVPGVMRIRAGLIIMAKYANSFGQLKEDHDAYEASYEKQGLDKNYKFPAVPFVNDNIATLPHQGKVLNITRDMKDNVLLPVDAGGGKSMLYILSILREMQSGQEGPFILHCPSHLVAQYVKEFVYATAGRVNVIPITSYTVRRHGLNRLGEMIKHSPKNTVLLVDYNVIKLRPKVVSYGTSNITIFPIIEFLRQFDPQVWYSDETHYLKSQSSRQAAVNRLIADIPKKRGASGTLVADTIKDLVKQAALFDPSVFGTLDDFIAEYALETRGSKVLEWKPGTESLVKSVMRRNFVIADAKRKEWAAILPTPVERFHPVDLTEDQQAVYEKILSEVVEDLQKRMEENAALKRTLGGDAGKNAKDEDDDENPSDDAAQEEDDSGEELDLDKMLNNSLSRLESFVLSPSTDRLGKEILKGDDLISPKVHKIVEICLDHLQKGIPGKILIFTNFIQSAQDIYDAFPPNIRDQVIHYTASRKEECGAQFEKDDSKRIMVGVEVSMNTGLNLQMASRLIRCQSVWTPGALEQGNARIGRPNIKKAEDRKEIYFDWIVSNRTIDVTKISYLMAKTISRAKFEEAGNPRFDELNVPKLFPMTISTIMETNDFNETLKPYFDDYAKYKQAIFAEWEEFKKKNHDLLFDENGKVRMERVKRSANLPDSKLIVRVPYVPGTEVYKAEDLGLVRYDEYFQKLLDSQGIMMDVTEEPDDDSDVEDDSDEKDDADDTSVPDRLRYERELMTGLGVHTDRGDGDIVKINKGRNLVIELPTGEKIRAHRMSCFIITRAETSNSDIRTQILKMTGDVPLDTPVEILESQMTDRKKRQLERENRKQGRENRREEKEAARERRKKALQMPSFDDEEDDTPAVEEEEAVTGLEIETTIVNDILGLRLVNVTDQDAADLAQTYGFKYSPGYFAAYVSRPELLPELFKKWKAEGFSMPKENSDMCRETFNHFHENRKKASWAFGSATTLALRNFYREEFKPDPRLDFIKPYPIIQDGLLYIALPERGHPASKAAALAGRIPGLKWELFSQGEELIAFTSTKSKTSALMRKILDAGVKVTNIDDLRKAVTKLKFIPD